MLRTLTNPKVLLAVIALWVLYEGVISQHSLMNLWRYRQEREALRQELDEAMAERDDYQRRLESLESDPFTVERLAREKLGLVKEGEIVYRYEEPKLQARGEGPLKPPILDEGEVEE